MHDTLTRLPNRILLEDRLEIRPLARPIAKETFRADVYGCDGFKTVNDAYGHDVGDKLLVAVTVAVAVEGLGTRWRVSVRIIRAAGRNRHRMMLPHWQIHWCASLIAVPSRSPELMVTLSIGIALYPHDGKTDRELMFNADADVPHETYGSQRLSLLPAVNEYAGADASTTDE